MNYTDLLFNMLDHPEDYSEAQWQEILADNECRELYKMMVKAKSTTQPTIVTDDDIDAEWQRLVPPEHHQSTVIPLWRKIAAAAAITIALFGFTYAAVQTHFFGLTKSGDKVGNTQDDRQTSTQDERTEVALDEITVEQTNDSIVQAEPRLYDNVPLEQVLNDLAARYNVTVEYRNENARSLRLYYEWQPDYTLDKVIEMLNNFESFSIHRDGDKLIVESSNQQEGKQ